MQPTTRLERNHLDPMAYQTFSITVPRDRMVQAACEQVGCEAWRNGWESVINEGSDLGRAQADYIRTRAGRTFREQKTGGGFTVFRFDSGQRCFAEHQTRPELYAVRDGDHRGNPTGQVRTHSRPEDWVEHMAENLDAFKASQERG